MTLKINVMVLHYNGRRLLETYLPSIEKAVARSKNRCRLTVVDNGSTDDSLDYLKQNFPNVLVYQARENRVLCSYNEAAQAVDDDIVLLLNNDIRVDEDFIDPLIKPFMEDKATFFVTPRCLSLKDNSYEGNKTRAQIRFGIFGTTCAYPGHEKEILKRGVTFQGGFGAFERKKFLELGGYDDLFLPGRLEDADICFRAQQIGWKCLYEPESVVYHEGGASFHKAFGIKKTLVINWRNTFLFMFKNLNILTLIALIFFWLPLRLVVSIVRFKPELAIGFFESLPKMGSALNKRMAWKKRFLDRMRVDDNKIFGGV